MSSDLPRTWTEESWGEVLELVYGKGIGERRALEGPVPVYGTNGPTAYRSSEAMGEGLTIVIGRKGAYRGVTWCPGPFWVIDTAFFVRPKRDLDLDWAYRALSVVDINHLDSGSAIPSTRREDVYALPVRMPRSKSNPGSPGFCARWTTKSMQMNASQEHCGSLPGPSLIPGSTVSTLL